MYYLAKIYYKSKEEEGEETKETYRLIDAQSENWAKNKIEKHLEAQKLEYLYVDILPTID